MTENSSVIDWEKTSLKPYVEMLDLHVRGLMEKSRIIKRQNGTYVEVSIHASTHKSSVGGEASLEY